MNKVILIGRVGADAELTYVGNGNAVANFSVATTETWKDKNGQRCEKTEWHRLVMWGKGAESLARYITKGRLVQIEGKMVTEKYRKEGETSDRYSTKVKVDDVQFLDKKKEQTAHTPGQVLSSPSADVLDAIADLDFGPELEDLA